MTHLPSCRTVPSPHISSGGGGGGGGGGVGVVTTGGVGVVTTGGGGGGVLSLPTKLKVVSAVCAPYFALTIYSPAAFQYEPPAIIESEYSLLVSRSF